MNLMGLQTIYKSSNTISIVFTHTYLESFQSRCPIRFGAAHHLHPVKNGFVYLVAIIDWANRKALSWRLSNAPDASFCVEALEEAIAKYGKP